MSNAAAPSLKPLYSPLDLQSRPLVWQVGAVVLGTLFLAASSYISVPMIPVPITTPNRVGSIVASSHNPASSIAILDPAIPN